MPFPCCDHGERTGLPAYRRGPVAALFDRWNADVQTGDPQRVVENYARDSMLLPTVSNTPRQTPEAKLDYFQHFTALKPKGEIVSRMVMIECNSALDTGLYSFHFADGATVLRVTPSPTSGLRMPGGG